MRLAIWIWSLLFNLAITYLGKFVCSFHISTPRTNKRTIFFAIPPSIIKTNSLPTDLIDKIAKYLQYRENDIIVIEEENDIFFQFNITQEIAEYNQTINEIVYGIKPVQVNQQPNSNAFVDMFQPSGWYRDNSTDQLQKQLRDEFPVLHHPFSYQILSKYGFGDLSPLILVNGGPYVVGQKIGLKWQVPKELPNPRKLIEELDEKRKEEANKQSSLMLGGALEEQLAAAEAMRLEDIKKRVALKQLSNSSSDTRSTNLEPDYRQQYLIALSKMENSLPNSLPPEKVLSAEERRKEIAQRRLNSVYLGPVERVHLSSLLLMTALAWGRSSQELASSMSEVNVVIEIARVVSAMIAASSIAASFLTFRETAALTQSIHSSQDVSEDLKTKPRINSILWTCRSLLGGLPTLEVLRKLVAEST